MRAAIVSWKRLTRFCVIPCMAIMAATAGIQNGAAEPRVLKNAVFWGPDSAITKKVIDPWSDEIEQRSNGRLKIERYYAGSLVKGSEQYEALASGAVDISTVFPVYERGKFYIEPLLGLPLALPPDPEAAQKITKSIFTKWVTPNEIHKNILLLTYDPTSPYRFISKTKISTFSDLSGLKFRSAGGASTDTVNALGGTPVALASAEIYEALSRGLIDGTFHSLSAVWDWKYYELVDYATGPGLGVAILSLAMSKRAFESLPEDLQNLILEVSNRYQGSMTRAYWATESEHLPEMGIEIVEFSDAEVAKAAARIVPLYEAWMDGVREKRGIDGKMVLKDLVSAWRENGHTPPDWMVELAN